MYIHPDDQIDSNSNVILCYDCSVKEEDHVYV